MCKDRLIEITKHERRVPKYALENHPQGADDDTFIYQSRPRALGRQVPITKSSRRTPHYDLD